MLLSLPATDLSSGLAALWDSGWFRPSQPSTFRASHGECPLLFCTLLPSYWEEDQWDNGHVGRFRGEPKKAPWPLDNTDKQIFLHVISKTSIRLSKCSSKGEKCFCFYSLLSDRPASLMMLYIRTVQCLHIFFWTLQYLLFTQLPKNHSTLGAGSRMLIHVLKQHFHLPWSLRTLQNPCLLIFQTDSPSVGKGMSLHLHMQVSGYVLGTGQKISCVLSSIWCPNTRSCCNGGSLGQPRHSLG